MLSDLLRLARPYQYTKNLFVFIPAFFAFQLTNADLVIKALLAFVAFSLVASAVYIFNDWIDRHEDAQHPEKKSRPLASGRIKAPIAFTTLALLLLGGGVVQPFSSHLVFFI